MKAGTVCLAVSVIAKPQGPGLPLAVIVHGDGGGQVNERYLARLVETGRNIGRAVPTAGVVIVQRPGYSSTLGRSEGVAKAGDDDYTAENVAHMAAAIAALRESLRPSRVVWVGHSGGSALGALVAGTKPMLVDAAVLAGCPCGDIREWRTHRNYSRGRPQDSVWPSSLSPIQFQDALPSGMEAVLLTGEKDDNTLPRFAQAWVAKASAKGVAARLIVLPGVDHAGSLTAPETIAHAVRLLGAP